MELNFEINTVLKKIIEEAKEDGLITDEEEELIKSIKLEGKHLERQIKQLATETDHRYVLNKLISSANKKMLKNVISKARQDGRISKEEEKLIILLFSELGYNLKEFASRPWYVFKICINIGYKSNIDNLLDYLDKIFCLRGIDPVKVYSGLCLGTKHYVIDDVDVTLLTFAVTPDTDAEWVTKGAFDQFDYDPDTIEEDLNNTANKLIEQNYFSKIK